MRTLQALCAALAAVAMASALVPDPGGFALRMPAGLLLVVLGAMATAGHAVPARRPGLVAGLAALAGGVALLARVGATGGLVLGTAILLAQAAPLVARRRARHAAGMLAAHD